MAMDAATITSVHSRLIQMVASVNPEMPKPNKVVGSMVFLFEINKFLASNSIIF
jgi:hypothetical protein